MIPRRERILVYSGLALAVAALVWSVVAALSGEDLVGRASVVDGDTVEIQGKRVRFDGIDAHRAVCRSPRASGGHHHAVTSGTGGSVLIQVLHDGGEMELIACSEEPAQSHPLKTAMRQVHPVIESLHADSQSNGISVSGGDQRPLSTASVSLCQLVLGA